MIKKLENITKSNINNVALHFRAHNSVEEILNSSRVIEDSGHGTLFLESKIYDEVRFSIHKTIKDIDTFSSITFFNIDITIAELVDTYPIYSSAYIPHDDEICYIFKSVTSDYLINAFIKENQNREYLLETVKPLRLTIKW